jgi:hypothetical protein
LIKILIDNDTDKGINYIWRNNLVHPKAKRLTTKMMVKDNAFDPNKIDNTDYQFVKKTLQDVYKFFEENEIVPNKINWLK